jgi:hypothetical protein
MSYVRPEGLPDLETHAILLFDASGSMAEKELRTGGPKHKRVAWLGQEGLNRLDDPQYADTSVTYAGFSGDRTGVKIVTLLEDHCPYDLKTYTGNTDLDYWDLLTPEKRKQGMGNMTPIGAALAWARERAEQWVKAASGQVPRRAVIFLLSDGQNNVGVSGREEKKALEAFNATCECGEIKLATIGYFQYAEGTNTEEDEGRRLLKELPVNPAAYFGSDQVEEILGYILWTITQVMEQNAA